MPTALVVAIDEARRDALNRELATAGLEPILATDGKEAERNARAALPSTLILDRGMSGLALFRLYSALRGLPGGADVPIYFVGQTGTDTPTDHYLPGEVSVQEVVGRVRSELGAISPVSAPAPSEPTTTAPPAAEHAAVGAAAVRPSAPPEAAERAAPTIEPSSPAEPAASAAQPAATAPPVEPVAKSVPPVPDHEATPVAEERAPVPAGGVASRISRLDVVLLRLGLVLLLLGGAVLLLRPDSSTQPVAPPNLATATPAATSTAAPSPSPAAQTAPGR